MLPASSRIAANLVLTVAGGAAAYVIVTTPPLRRLAWRAARRWLGTGIPLYLLGEVRRAWMESQRIG